MYRYLRELDEEDEFWDNEMNFDKQVCFNNYLGPQVGDYKNWFEEGEASFGRGCSRLFNRWKKDHVEDRDLFVESIKRIAYKLK